jgi:iron complex outermembrane receptor protein
MRLTTALLGAASLAALAAPALAAEASSNQAFGLGQIVVTAPRTEGVVAVDTATLSSEAIYAFNRPTLDEAVNLIPGVASSNTGGSRNERVVSVRGFNRFQVPLLIDGIRVFLPADNRLDYGRFLTPDIAEIQVAKGYVSVLDGPDGMGGAINLVTRKPNRPFEAEARATVEGDRDLDYQGYNVFALLGTRHNKWYAQGSFTRSFRDHTTLPGGFTPTPTEDGGMRELSRTEDWRANLKVGFTPNATDEYSLSYTRQEGEKLAPLSTTDALSTQRFWTWPYWNLDSLYFLSTTALNDRVTLKTKAYLNSFDNLLRAFDSKTLDTQTLGRAFNSYYDDNSRGAAATLAWRATDADTLSAAFNWRRDKHMEWQQSFPAGATEPEQTQVEDVYSLGLENALALSPRVTFTAGLGYDWRDLSRAEDYTAGAFVFYPLKDGNAWSAQGKIAYRPDDASELHFSISSRARFPTIFERFSSRFGGAVSNPSLESERATNWELGGSLQTGPWSLDGAVFYSRLNDVIVNFPFIYVTCTPAGACTNNAVTQSRNLGHGEYYGFEASARGKLSEALSVGGNYTFTHRMLSDPTNAAFRPTDVPTHKAFLYADWSPVQKLHVLPSVDLASNRWTVISTGARYYRTGAYAQVGLRADYAVTDKVEIGVGARNLFDDNYQLVDGFPEPGRSWFASIRARY